MKVCLIIDSLGAGGTEKSIQLWGAYLHRAGHTIHFIYFQKNRSGVEASMEGLSLHFLAARHIIPRFFKLLKLLKTLKPDLVHASLFQSNLMLRFTRIFYRKPV